MKEQDVLFPILAGTALFVLLSVFINLLVYLFKQRRRQHLQELSAMKQAFNQILLQSQIEVQESTYRHIAKELHDNVGQLLSTTKMLMGITALKLGHAPDTLNTANATLAKAIQEIRLLSRSLDKEWLERFNFLENLQDEVARINSGEVVHATVDCPVAIDMKPEEQIILFRIVQEAVQNAVRHGQPSRLAIHIANGDGLEVRVVNDGKPLPPDFHGMGTSNMRHRAKLFGGSVHWRSAPAETVVTIRLPQNAAHEN